MQPIQIFAYICFGFAALGVILALGEDLFLIIPALVLFVTGVLLMALDKIITTLVEIRDALVGKDTAEIEPTSDVSDGRVLDVEAKPTRTMSEIQADLDKLKQKLPTP